MSDPAIYSVPEKHKPAPANPWLDRLGVILLASLLVGTIFVLRSGRLCDRFATDYRGYHAAAQIALQRGFAAVYQQPTQDQFQAALAFRCPDGRSLPPRLNVSMPYLPAFVLFFLPLTALEFTDAYVLWVLLSLAALLVYLWRFSAALGERPVFWQALVWVLGVPLLSNLALGQANVFLVICLGEFVLANVQGRRIQGGLWLGAMIMKPHVLILLLPGLFLRKEWKVLLGFTASTLALLLLSLLLAGSQGVWDALGMAAQFSGGLIQTGPAMMNFRALALNLAELLPGWLAWGVAILGMALVAGITLYLWRGSRAQGDVGWIILIIATQAATFVVTWHAHFYLLSLLIPLLLALDLKKVIPPTWRWAWLLAPPLFFGLCYLVNPTLGKIGLGLGMLALSLFLFAWGARRLMRTA